MDIPEELLAENLACLSMVCPYKFEEIREEKKRCRNFPLRQGNEGSQDLRDAFGALVGRMAEKKLFLRKTWRK